MFVTVCTLVISVFILNPEIVSSNEMVFDQLKFLNSTYLKDVYNISTFRIAKFNRTLYVMNVELEWFVDVDANFEVEVSFYFNRLNNNQYSKTILRLKRANGCDLMNKYYDSLIANELKGHTNIPTNPGELRCPLKKVNYSKKIPVSIEIQSKTAFFFFKGSLLDKELFLQ